MKTNLIFATAITLGISLVLAVFYERGQLGGAPGRQNRLFVAVWSDNTNEVTQSLKEGADPNGRSNQANHPTPLMDAVWFGHAEIARRLLAKGADPNKTDRDGHTAMRYLLASPYLGGREDNVSYNLVKLLLEASATTSNRDILDLTKNLPFTDPRKRALAELTNEQGGPR